MPSKISVIVVNYHAHDELFLCLKSISASPDLEIIVVDNDESPTIFPQVNQTFPQAKYLRSPGNIGYGSACNLGAASASGNYLFFLNPDTRILSDSLSRLSKFLDTHPSTAVVSPLLLDARLHPYPWVGTQTLTPLAGIFALSFIGHLWPHNPVSEKYWIHTDRLRQPVQIGVAPGTALMVRSGIFRQAGGFDPRFFLYFEESDLCKRIGESGHSLYLIPEAKIIHYWAKSTPDQTRSRAAFTASRYYYFKKHFGLLPALTVEFFCRLSFKTLLGIK